MPTEIIREYDQKFNAIEQFANNVTKDLHYLRSDISFMGWGLSACTLIMTVLVVKSQKQADRIKKLENRLEEFENAIEETDC